MIKLFWCPKTRSSRVVWMLEELGVEYERVHIDIRDPAAPRDADFGRASPMGKVPAIVDGDATVADSAAIALYLADRYSAGNLAPSIDAADRGEYLYWMVYTPGVIEPAMAEKVTGMEPNRVSFGWGDFPTMVATLEARLTDREWLLDRFTAADVMVGSSCAFLKQFNLLPESPAIESYIERCLARPAYKRALEIDEAGA